MTADIDSGRVGLLTSLKDFTERAVGDMMLPVRVQSEQQTEDLRPAHVYLMRLPDMASVTKKAPYIIHQLVTARDTQKTGQTREARAQVRSVFCVYCDDGQEGALMLLNLMERLRIALLRETVIDKRYILDISAAGSDTEGLEMLIYPEDNAPYFIGEMISTWHVPSVEREVRQWL